MERGRRRHLAELALKSALRKSSPVTGSVKLELLLSTDHLCQIITYQFYVSQANAMHC